MMFNLFNNLPHSQKQKMIQLPLFFLLMAGVLNGVNSFRSVKPPAFISLMSSYAVKQKADIPIDVISRDFTLTDPLRSRVAEKIEKTLQKLGHDILSASVVLRVIKFSITEAHSQTTKKDSQIAEVTIGFKGGAVLHASERTDDMYASIDIVSHKLAQSLKKHNEKVRSKRFKEKSQLLAPGSSSISAEDLAEIDALTPSFNEEDLLIDLDQKYKNVVRKPLGDVKLEVIRPKSFPMPPISVNAALNALELIDHPFYVFRNKDTNEINVIYRRTSGGVGLIMPEK